MNPACASMMRLQAPELADECFAIFPNALHTAWTTLDSSHRRSQAPAARKFSLPSRFLLSVARLSRHDRAKGIISVIEALRMIAEDRDNVAERFLIFRDPHRDVADDEGIARERLVALCL